MPRNRRRSVQNIHSLWGGSAPGAGRVLLNGGDGIALSFFGKSIAIIDSGTPANNVYSTDVASYLTYTAPSVKRTLRADGRVLATNGTTELPYEWDASGNALGILMEPDATNYALYSRTMTNAAWVISNTDDIIVAKDVTGPDGVDESAHSLTNAATDSTIIQTITLGSGSRMSSCYVKRQAGTGAIYISTDVATTGWGANIASSINSSTWTRIETGAVTVTNPQVGFKMATSGDAIEVDFWQTETGPVVTSPIVTVASTVPRAYDNIKLADVAPLGMFDGVAASVWVKARAKEIADTRYLADMAVDADNRIVLTKAAATPTGDGISGATSSAVTDGTVAADAEFTFAVRVKLNDDVASLNVTALGTKDETAALPIGSYAVLQIGNNGVTPATGATFSGHIKELVLKPIAASDATIILTPDNWAV